ncbi:MAG: ketoacyl-ACP synthase III [Bacteroidota bacterium]
MFINRVSYYVPELRIPNAFFEPLNGLTEDWILERTGIKERRKAKEGENSHTMSVEATRSLIEQEPKLSAQEIDLVVAGTYTAYDTVTTMGHAIQNFLDCSEIPVVTISSACSTLLNAVEIVEGYFAMGKASTALVVVSDHNSAYYNAQDPKSGHLWGDGAAALLISKERSGEKSLKIKKITTAGAGNVGQAMNGVSLKPFDGGIQMPGGRDVFLHACNYMAKSTKEILDENGYSVDDLTYLIPHQANLRITKNVAQNLGIDESKAVTNVTYLGNTGCAGCGIGLAEKWDSIKKDDIIVMTVFGGGYSYGAMLLEA